MRCVHVVIDVSVIRPVFTLEPMVFSKVRHALQLYCFGSLSFSKPASYLSAAVISLLVEYLEIVSH